MNSITTMSAKGQVVIPKDVRDRLRLRPGEKLEVVETSNGISLNRVDARERISMEEANRRLAPIRALYNGPPVTIEEMNETIAERWRQAALRSDARD